MKEEMYQNPLADRYCSAEMSALFGQLHCSKIWRKLWIALAESQRELGLNISQAQIDDLYAHCDDINFEAIKKHELNNRHDVMSHILAYGEQSKLAKPILHLGATSNFVKDNADIVIFRQALNLIGQKLLVVVQNLSKFAMDYKDLPTLGWTHLQPAQLTTVGKRASLWLYDFVCDFDDLTTLIAKLKLRGAKGTTGTQASFLDLFDGDHEKVVQLDSAIAKKFGFDSVFPLTGQTYSRKVDFDILTILSSVAMSAGKFGTDMRLLSSKKELEEPFEHGQVGSSAMAYKRNPMRCERLCGIARFVVGLPINLSVTASTQWLERSLDDSANRRIVMSQAFLAVDSILNLMIDVTSGIVVYPKVILKNINAELPFMVTENILMQATKLGGDRQTLHERIRQHSMAVACNIKQHGQDNDLIQRLRQDTLFEGVNFDDLLNPILYIGRASQQVSEYFNSTVKLLLDKNRDKLACVPIHKIEL